MEGNSGEQGTIKPKVWRKERSFEGALTLLIVPNHRFATAGSIILFLHINHKKHPEQVK